MTANKRKRDREEEQQETTTEEDVPQVKEPEQKKKPHSGTSGLFLSAAVKKIAELDKLLNEVNEEEEDDDYNSDYSDSSELGQQFDNNSSDSGQPVISGESAQFNPEIVGFAICAQETMSFLRKEGFSEDNPLIQSMQSRLLDQLKDYQLKLNGMK